MRREPLIIGTALMNMLLSRNRAALLALVTGLAGIFANIAVGSLPEVWKGYLWVAWIPFVLATLLTVVLSLPNDDERGYEGKKHRLLEIVRSQTQEELRQKLFYPAHVHDPQADYRLTLTVEPRPDLLPQPSLLREHPDAPPLPISPGTPIARIFEDSGRSLLIVGEPGAGKSTLLLELALALANSATGQALPERVPVVLNLASWAQRRAPLTEWLVEALEARYGVGRTVGRRLVADDALIPLLDGLDELDKDARGACVEAVSTFVSRTLTPIAVCSRVKEYEELVETESMGRFARRLALREALCVQQLEAAQIEAYLAMHSTTLAGVAHAWRSMPVLRVVLTTPLMLNVAAIAFDDASVVDVSAADEAGLRRQLWASYIRRMLDRPGGKGATEDTTLYRQLRWLARVMARRNLTTLYIERMQPGWLPRSAFRAYRLAYVLAYILAFGLVFGLVSGLVSGLAVGLVFGLVLALDETGFLDAPQGARLNWRGALTFGLVLGLVLGLVGGLVGGLATSGWVTDQIDERGLTRPNEGMFRSAFQALRAGLTGGLSGALVGFVAVQLNTFFDAVDVSTLPENLPLLLAVLGVYYGAWSSGGRACLHHLALRWALWLHLLGPLHYSMFLDDAARRLLLRRVGGGYEFWHRELRDILAAEAPRL
ncbi:MAG: hypothetical protein RLZZ387_4788 [Chloroflexota bacterium]